MYNLRTPEETARYLSSRLKNLRLLKKWKRTTLAERSGISLGSLIRFEQTGQISMKNFLSLLSALGRMDEIEKLLLPQQAKTIEDLEQLDKLKSQRGSI